MQSRNSYRILCYITVLLWPFSIFSQDTGIMPVIYKNRAIDSLEILLKEDKADSNKVIHTSRLCKEYTAIGLYDTARYYGNIALKLARYLNLKKREAYAHHYVGNSYLNQSNYPKALMHYNIALRIGKEIGDKKGIIPSLNNIGNIYSNQGNVQEALKYYLMSLELFKSLNDQDGIAGSYSNIGILYNYQGNYPAALQFFFAGLKLQGANSNYTSDIYSGIGNVFYYQGKYKEALKYYFISLKLKKDIGQKPGIIDKQYNIGNVYFSLGDYSKAREHYLIALQISEEIGDQQSISSCYLSLGSIYKKQGNFHQALKNYLVATKISEEIGTKTISVDAFSNLGSLYVKLNQPKQAHYYLNNSLKLAKELGYKEGIKMSHQISSELDSIQGNWKSAYQHQQLFMLYKDSLDNEETRKKIIQASMTYEFEKKEAAIKAAQDKKDVVAEETKRQQRLIILSVILILLLVAGFLYSRYVIVKKQAKIVETQKEQEKNVLEQTLLRTQMNPHFIFNATIAIQQLIKTDMKNESIHYLNKFTRLTRQILEYSRKEYISLQDEIQCLENYFSLQKLLYHQGFDYSITVSINDDADEVLIPPMLTQPFIENAIQHGISKKQERGIISVSFEQHQEWLNIKITDNGLGIQTKHKDDNTISMATSITRERLALLNIDNTINLENRIDEKGDITGTRLFFKIPYLRE